MFLLYDDKTIVGCGERDRATVLLSLLFVRRTVVVGYHHLLEVGGGVEGRLVIFTWESH